MRGELDKRNVGGAQFQTGVVLDDEDRKSHEDMMMRMVCVYERNDKTFVGLNNNGEFLLAVIMKRLKVF